MQYNEWMNEWMNVSCLMNESSMSHDRWSELIQWWRKKGQMSWWCHPSLPPSFHLSIYPFLPSFLPPFHTSPSSDDCVPSLWVYRSWDGMKVSLRGHLFNIDLSYIHAATTHIHAIEESRRCDCNAIYNSYIGLPDDGINCMMMYCVKKKTNCFDRNKGSISMENFCFSLCVASTWYVSCPHHLCHVV